MLFFRSVSRLFAWWRAGFSALPLGVAGFAVALFWLVVGAVLSPLFVVWAVLRAVLFARFPRPAFVPSGAWAARFGCSWRCVSAAALPRVRASRCVWAVLPAVVSRRSGVVSFFWVFVA